MKKITITCPNNNCKRKLAIPKTENRLHVTCPLCNENFSYWKVKWYHRAWFIILMLMMITPLGLLFLWISPRFKNPTKIGLTICFSLYFIAPFPQRDIYRDMYKSYYRMGEELLLEEIYLPTKSFSSAELISTLPVPRYVQSDLSWEEVVSRYKKSIVSIKTFDKKKRKIGSGSGFVISEQGHIVTNYHVLSGAHSVEISFEKGEKAIKKAYLLAKDNIRDLAILKTDVRLFSFLYLGDSDEIKSGQEVMAIGSPLGLERSASSGIISGIRVFEDTEYIQITVPVSSGNSGGPLLNRKGEVVGVVTLASLPIIAQNLNFAVPINYIKKMIKQSK